MFLHHVQTNNFKKPTSGLMQLLQLYTQFGYLYNIYLLLISFSSSTLLYVINVPQHHWQLNTCKQCVQKLCMTNLSLMTTLQIMQESTKFFFRKGIISSAAAKG